jgi:hypothetical protein
MHRFRVSPSKVTLILLLIVTALLLGGIATQYVKYVYGHDAQFGVVRLLNLEGEGNLPSWFSSFLLLLSSAMLFIIGLHHKREASPYNWHWLVLGVIFLSLSRWMKPPVFMKWRIRCFVGCFRRRVLSARFYR